MWGELHEKKEIKVALQKVMGSGEGNRLFRELGATLHYDVYSFEAEESEIWQSGSLLYIELKFKGSVVDAQEDFDEIGIHYLLATRPSSDQQNALNLVVKIIEKFNGNAFYLNKIFSPENVKKTGIHAMIIC